MRIGLIDVDGHNYPNLPLMKLSAWHKSKGDEVGWYDLDIFGHMDRVYMSKVFSFSEDYLWPIDADEIIRGGTGYAVDLVDGKEVFDKSRDANLPDEIEHIYPDYGLYGITDTAYGFTSRGCMRGCLFCIVGKKEGLVSHKVADLSEFWRGQKKIVLCDPNVLACRDWKDILQQCIDSGARIEFNQGMDIRLMTKEKAEMIKQIKLEYVHFAWDRYEDKELIQRNLTLFTDAVGEKYNRKHVQCYVLVNFDTSMEQNVERCEWLRSKQIAPYVMIYNKKDLKRGNPIYKLARWCNNRVFLWKYSSFQDYLEHEKETQVSAERRREMRMNAKRR